MHWLVDWHCRHYFVTKCHQQTIQRASLLCIYLSSNCYAFLFYFFFCDGILLVNISCNKWHIRWHADECGEITSDTCKVYISPVHTTSSWLNIMQPNHHTSCFRRPHRLILPFIGAGSYQHPPLSTAQYPKCSIGALLAYPVNRPTCSIHTTRPYVHIVRLPAFEKSSITSSVV